mmetsp:Transcript_13441/g.15190  ORF Transcript_13441/g.15190 Transcript_13441/m.15190 type:complete len:89 (+) Transcript_13441:96-362(+)
MAKKKINLSEIIKTTLTISFLNKHNNYIIYQFIYFLNELKELKSSPQLTQLQPQKVGQMVPSMQPPPVTTPFSPPMIPPPLLPSTIAA